MKTRCEWAGSDPLYIKYHDNEWGIPLHDDRKLFELLILEGAQAGLSWLTILKKRPNYRKAFNNFDPEIVAKFDSAIIKKLLSNKGIIRNRLKIEAAIQNAGAFLDIQRKFGSFDTYIRQFTKGKPIKNAWKNQNEIPSKTKESMAMSVDLKKKGFKFAGPGNMLCFYAGNRNGK